jgi:ribonuclease Z
VVIHELAAGERVVRDAYDIVAFRAAHGSAALGFALVEHDRLGRFDPERARALGVPEGPLFGRLHRGERITVEGRMIDPAEVVGPARAGRRIVYTGDTAPSLEVVEAARGCDLLIHDCTFSEEELDRARETQHATAADAARVAREAGARRLVLTHISARYSDAPALLEREATQIFQGARVAYDGMVMEIPYQEEDGADA